MTTPLKNVLSTAKSDIATILSQQQTAAAAYGESSRKRTYMVAQHLVTLGRELLKEENTYEFLELMKANGISMSTGTNTWAYVVKLAMPGDKTWLNRTGALRSIDRHAGDSSKIAKFIEGFNIQKIKKITEDAELEKLIGDSKAARMDGLAKLDKLYHRDKNAKSDDQLVEDARNLPELDLTEQHITDASVKVVLLWASVDAEGRVTPRGIVNKSAGAAKNAAIAAAKAFVTPQAIKDAQDAKRSGFAYDDDIGSTTAPKIVISDPETLDEAVRA
nr:hypothetical protein [uncultured Brevundimonas sp.]